MEVLVLDGKEYVKASKAARDLGYATDYVGQLCRGGKIDAHLIGRTWYVNQDELSTHKVEKKRNSRAKAREYAKKSIAAHKEKIQTKVPDTYASVHIRYESDQSELIPTTRKLSIATEGETKQKKTFADFDETKTIVENKGEKVVMSGELHVVDVTDASTDPDTTILTPTRIKSTIHSVSDTEEKIPLKTYLATQQESVIKDPEVSNEDVYQEEKMPFRERLHEVGVTTDTVALNTYDENTVESEVYAQPSYPRQPQATVSLTYCFSLILSSLALSLYMLSTSYEISYFSNPAVKNFAHINFSPNTEFLLKTFKNIDISSYIDKIT